MNISSLSVTTGPAHDPEGLLEGWRVAMQAEGRAPATIALRLQVASLAARAAGCRVDQLTTADVRIFLAARRTPATRSTYYNCLAALGVYLVAEGIRGDDPTAAIRPPRTPRGTPRPCSTIAFHAILAASRERTRAMVLLGALQGLRAHEVAKVRGDDLDLAAGTLYVRGKGGRDATLPLHPEIAVLARTMPARGWWFPSPAGSRRGQPVLPTAVTSAVKRACKAAGVPVHGAHPLRHYFGTSLVRNGADLRVTQELMRHASLATTQIYVEASDEARRAAVFRLPGLPEGGGAR